MRDEEGDHKGHCPTNGSPQKLSDKRRHLTSNGTYVFMKLERTTTARSLLDHTHPNSWTTQNQAFRRIQIPGPCSFVHNVQIYLQTICSYAGITTWICAIKFEIVSKCKSF